MATRKRNTNLNEENIIEVTPPVYNARQAYVMGWENAEQVASDIWASVHSTLLSGALLFAYKSTNTSSDLVQVVVVKNLPSERSNGEGYGVGMITTGFSMLLPKVPIEYLAGDLLEDLKKYKVNKEIVDTYIQIIKLCKENG